MVEKLRYLISLVGEETVSPAAGKARNSLKRLERDLARAATVNKKYAESGGKIQATYKDMNVGAKKFNATMSIAKDITDMSGKRYRKLEKDLDLLEKQYPGVGKRIKGYTREIRESGTAIKEIDSVQKKNTKVLTDANQKQIEANKIWKTGQRTQDYTRKLISMNGAEYQKLTSRISETGDAQKIADDLRLKGHKALSPELKKRLAMRIKEIDAVRKAGVTVDANTKKQHEAIMKLNDSLKKYGTATGAARRGLEGMFGAVKKAGLVFLTLLGPLFLVGAALRTVKQAADWVFTPFIKFEDALYELRKTANLTKKEMLDIGISIAELSLTVPIAAEELAKITGIAGRLGIRGKENILTFTETVAKFATVTVYSSEEAAQALAKIAAAFEVPMTNIFELASAINQLANTTASTSRDIVEAMKRIGASGKLIGITAQESAAMTATLVDMGMQAQRAGTRIRRALSEMARNAEEIDTEISGYFQNWADVLVEDPMRAIQIYLEYINQLEDPVKKTTFAIDTLGKVGGFAILSLAQNSKQLDKNLETVHHEMIYGSSLVEEYAIAIDKTSSSLQLATNRAEAAQRAVGEDMIPVLIKSKNAWAKFLWFVSGTSYAIERGKDEADSMTSVLGDLDGNIKLITDDVGDVNSKFEEMAFWQKQNAQRAKAGLETKPWTKAYIKALTKIEAELVSLSKTNEDVEESNQRMFASAGGLIGLWKTQGTLTSKLTKLEDEYADAKERINKATELGIKAAEKGDPEIEAKATATLNDAKRDEFRIRTQIIESVGRESNKRLESGSILEENRHKTEDFMNDLDILHGMHDILFKDEELDIALAIKRGKIWDKLGTIISKETLENIDNIEDLGKAVKDVGWEFKEVGGMIRLFEIPREGILTLEELNEALEDTSELLGYSIRDLKGFDKELERVWNRTGSYISILRDAGDAQIEYDIAMKKMPRSMKNLIAPYEELISEVTRLKEADKDVEAAEKLRVVAREIYAKREVATSSREREDLGRILDLLDLQARAIGILPEEVENIEKEFEELEALSRIHVEADTIGYDDAINRLLEQDIVKEIRVTAEGKLVPEIPIEGEGQFGIKNVPKTGIYKLHKGEEVITKKEASQNVENKNWNINMGGVSLSQNYGFDKFMRDVEEFSLSRL